MGRYNEARAPSGNPANGERDVWFGGGEVKFGHYVSASDVWVVDRAIGYLDRVSRLLPEDTSPHFHTNLGIDRKIYAREIPMKTGFTKGTPVDGKTPLMNLDMFASVGGSKTYVNEVDAMEVSIPFAYILKLNPSFNVETGELAFWDEVNSIWLTAAQAGLTVTRTSDGFKIIPATWPTDDLVIACW